MKSRLAMIALVTLALSLASSAGAVLVRWTWTAPCTEVVSYSSDPDALCEPLVETPIDDLKEFIIRTVYFNSPGDTMVTVIPATSVAGCNEMEYYFNDPPGAMGERMIWARDLWGNLSCIGNHYVFAVPYSETSPGIRARWYDASNLTSFRTETIESAINFDWDFGAPYGLGADTFSATFEGFITSSYTGEHLFTVRVEDGDSLKIGNQLIISDWAVQEEHERSGSANLTAGVPTPIRLSFFHNNGDAMLRVDWTTPGGLREPVPSSAFTY